MAASSLSIKLRCTSWQQLATIYRRDLSRGSMFLKASSQPPLGTIVKIDLELPSATVLELTGAITEHVVDQQRGTGVQLTLEALPTKTVWLIESALAAENKVRAQTQPGARTATNNDATPAESQTAMAEGENIAGAEHELVAALEAEAESLKKLNPFLVLGVGYETTDSDVRSAFGELTKRYHPDRFARYQSTKLRQIAAEIFILIRDAYRKLADADSRAQLRSTMGGPRPLARTATPPRAHARCRPANSDRCDLEDRGTADAETRSRGSEDRGDQSGATTATRSPVDEARPIRRTDEPEWAERADRIDATRTRK